MPMIFRAVILMVIAVFQFRQNSAMNKERLAETGVLAKLIEANNTALNKNAAATEERNRVTQDLADAIAKQASAVELVNQQVGFYHETNTEKLKDLREVAASSAEATRQTAGRETPSRFPRRLVLRQTRHSCPRSLARTPGSHT
jgi:methyl-accepting chemotaxis protein